MKRFISLGILLISGALSISFPPKLDSANLTSVSNSLSTSRLSVHGRVDSTGTTVGSSQVTMLNSTGADSAGDNAYTISTANLKAGDSVTIGTGSYTVVDILSSTVFTVTPVLASGDADNTDPIYLNQTAVHTVTFTTASAVADGFFQILLPADPDATNAYDGDADDAGYDFGADSLNNIDVVASDVGAYDFVTGVSTRSGATGCTSPANYHCFEVHYSGAGSVGQAITITIGGTTPLVSPATGASHTEATADTYPFLVKNFAAGSNPNSASPVDNTTGRVAHIEAVRVTATVDPTIDFTITGVASSATNCGANAATDIDTTTGTNAPLAVPFGTMSLNTFKDAQHLLTVSTNASGGYVVTAIEDDELGKDGGTTPFIPDTSCDSGPCTFSSGTDWVTATNNGFGYSLQNNGAASISFEWDDDTITTGFKAKQFANDAAAESAQTLFSSTTVANAEGAYVCYRLSVGATQAAGDYENQITYTATGTF